MGDLIEGGLVQILKHRFHLEIVFIQNLNNYSKTLNGTDYLQECYNYRYVFECIFFSKQTNWAA